ncbi:MAG: ATP-binding protein, partial [Planctomycetia bacterium]|nr:ATP-binding protein [Planctomycetia bacterium]
ILENALAFVLKNMKVQTRIDPHTGKRLDKTEYPIPAVREAILNALVHRDYSIHTEGKPIELTMFKDRMEIRNPGGLYGKLTIDQLGNIQPDTRNKRLARLLETLKITENRYSGIPTIRRELKEAGLKPPVFADSRNEFQVTFFNEPIEERLNINEKEQKLLEFCRTPRTRQEIAEWLGVKSAAYAMSRNVKPLLERGLLKMTLPGTPQSKDQKFFSE